MEESNHEDAILETPFSLLAPSIAALGHVAAYIENGEDYMSRDEARSSIAIAMVGVTRAMEELAAI